MGREYTPGAIYTRNLEKYKEGQLDLLHCYECHHDTVSVYFDGPHIFRGEYWTRVYFFCKKCKHWDRFTYPGIPPHFRNSRDISCIADEKENQASH